MINDINLYLDFKNFDLNSKFAENIRILLNRYTNGDYGFNATVWDKIAWTRELYSIAELRGVQGHTVVRQLQLCAKQMDFPKEISVFPKELFTDFENFKQSLN